MTDTVVRGLEIMGAFVAGWCAHTPRSRVAVGRVIGQMARKVDRARRRLCRAKQAKAVAS